MDKDTTPSALALKVARQHYGLRRGRQLGPDEPGTEGAADLAAIIDYELAPLVERLRRCDEIARGARTGAGNVTSAAGYALLHISQAARRALALIGDAR